MRGEGCVTVCQWEGCRGHVLRGVGVGEGRQGEKIDIVSCMVERAGVVVGEQWSPQLEVTGKLQRAIVDFEQGQAPALKRDAASG